MSDNVSASFLFVFCKKHHLASTISFKFGVFSLSQGPQQWADEFAAGKGQQGSAEDQWVNEFSKLNVDDWVDEFAEGPLGESSADAWANAYDE